MVKGYPSWYCSVHMWQISYARVFISKKWLPDLLETIVPKYLELSLKKTDAIVALTNLFLTYREGKVSQKKL